MPRRFPGASGYHHAPNCTKWPVVLPAAFYIFQSYIFELLTISFFERHSDANALVSCAAPTYPIVASQHEFKLHPKHILVLGVQRALGLHVRSPAL